MFKLLNEKERSFLEQCINEEKENEVHYHSYPKYETAELVKDYAKRLYTVVKENGGNPEEDMMLETYTNTLRHLIEFWEVYFKEGKAAAFKWQKDYDEAQRAKIEKLKQDREKEILDFYYNY